jgi:hypothetical protein
MKNILNKIWDELKRHLPFTFTAAFVSVAVMSLLLIKVDLVGKAVTLFYIFHPTHIFFSSLVSAAILYKYNKKWLYSLFLGGIISIIVGTTSDVIFPYLGSLLFHIPISFHLPFLEHPVLIFGSMILGGSAGVMFKTTKVPHFLHVFISVLASLLYIFSYSTDFSILNIVLIFFITGLSVTIPCCLSDIVFPVILGEKTHSHKEHKHKKNESNN